MLLDAIIVEGKSQKDFQVNYKSKSINNNIFSQSFQLTSQNENRYTGIHLLIRDERKYLTKAFNKKIR